MTDMLQKSENVAKNIANKNSQDLTEQWKKGELPEGWYYVKCDDEICFDRFTYYGGFSKIFNYSVKQILAPVPTFDEWQASEKYNKHLEEKIKIYERKDKQATETSIAYNELLEENEELKEILERHKKATAKAQIRSCDLEIINAQLKELLKECKTPLEVYNEMFGNKEELLAKIDEALK